MMPPAMSNLGPNLAPRRAPMPWAIMLHANVVQPMSILGSRMGCPAQLRLNPTAQASMLVAKAARKMASPEGAVGWSSSAGSCESHMNFMPRIKRIPNAIQ